MSEGSMKGQRIVRDWDALTDVGWFDPLSGIDYEPAEVASESVVAIGPDGEIVSRCQL